MVTPAVLMGLRGGHSIRAPVPFTEALCERMDDLGLW